MLIHFTLTCFILSAVIYAIYFKSGLRQLIFISSFFALAGASLSLTETRLAILFSGLLVIIMLFMDILLRVSAFILPASILCVLNILSAILLPNNYTNVDANIFTLSHRSFLVLSYSIFGISFILGLFFLLGQYVLKMKKGSIIGELPPLGTISKLNTFVILAGLLVFTSGIVTGYLYARRTVSTPGWRLDIMVILAALSWLIYLVTFISIFLPGFKEKRLAIGSVIGFLILYSAIFVSGLSIFHTFK